MRGWLRRIRGAVGMGVTWAIAWGVLGLLIGVASIVLPFLPWDAFFAVFDAPLPALAVPGFVAGALFSIVLGIAARRRRFRDLSLPRFTALGAFGGVCLSLVPATLHVVGLGTLRADLTLIGITATIIGPLTLLCAASAAGTLIVARKAERLDAGVDARAEVSA